MELLKPDSIKFRCIVTDFLNWAGFHFTNQAVNRVSKCTCDLCSDVAEPTNWSVKINRSEQTSLQEMA